MEPRIQYATTKDGVRIAYATAGDGPPVVWMQNPLASHVQLEWQEPTLRMFYTAVAAKRMLVRYDTRGVGLSDREVDSLAFDGLVNDLETVVDRLGLETFALVAEEYAGLTAIPYAVRHPERVSRLILINSFARGAEVAETPRSQAILGLASDWEMFTENVGALVFGYGREEARHYGNFIRACIRPEALNRFLETYVTTDVSELLPKVGQPTLVIHHSGLEWHPMDTTRDLVARISAARLLVLQGMYQDNVEQFVAAIDEFLAEGGEPRSAFQPPAPSGLVTILFTDIESSTALTQRLGDAGAQELVRTHNTIVRDALEAQGGSEVKHTGDGIMASFPSASGALECAVAIQRAVAALRQAQGGQAKPPIRQAEPTPDQAEPVEAPLRVRIGLNAGEPVAEEQDLFGTAVQLARRVCDHAEPAQILASDVVRQLAAGKGFLFSDIGETELRGFEDPVKLWELRWREEA